MSDGRLRRMLVRRLREERMGPDSTFSIAELHRKLLPYGLTRTEMGYATKAEYDIALLELLRNESWVELGEEALRTAVADECRAAEPGLAFLQRYAASEIRLRPEAGDGTLDVPGSRDADAGPAAASPPPPGHAALGPDDGREAGVVSEGACHRCGGSLPERAGLRFCPHCGASQLHWPCGECGAQVERGWRYCPMCGRLQPAS